MQPIEQALKELRTLHEQLNNAPAPEIGPHAFIPFPAGPDPVAYAVDEARLRTATLVLLHVVDNIPGGTAAPLPAGYPMVPVQAFVEGAKERLAEFAAGIDGIAVETAVEVGRAAQDIVDYAQREAIDQIVIGSHSRGRLARVLLGSVAERVARAAPCPVTIIRCD